MFLAVLSFYVVPSFSSFVPSFVFVVCVRFPSFSAGS